jgi:hypothetical protein
MEHDAERMLISENVSFIVTYNLLLMNRTSLEIQSFIQSDLLGRFCPFKLF